MLTPPSSGWLPWLGTRFPAEPFTKGGGRHLIRPAAYIDVRLRHPPAQYRLPALLPPRRDKPLSRMWGHALECRSSDGAVRGLRYGYSTEGRGACWMRAGSASLWPGGAVVSTLDRYAVVSTDGRAETIVDGSDYWSILEDIYVEYQHAGGSWARPKMLLHNGAVVVANGLSELALSYGKAKYEAVNAAIKEVQAAQRPDWLEPSS